jgi:nucleotide-binding universal stress UspA family protein
MEKILLAVNGQQINSGTIDFACYMALLTKSKLTALFIKDKEFELPTAGDHKKVYHEDDSTLLKESKAISRNMDESLKFFLGACERRGVKADILIRGEVYGDKRSPVKETIDESRFADLLIVDPGTSFKNKAEALPTEFVKEVIAASECAVVIAPALFNGVDEIVFCYDGGRSSVFAMKRFTYLFPQLSNKNVILLEVDNQVGIVEQKAKISAWLQGHYRQVHFQQLQGQPDEGLLRYFLMKKNLFIVIGAYGRSLISNFLKKSSADLLMRVIDLPIFISHH